MVDVSYVTRWEQFCAEISRNVEILRLHQHDQQLSVDSDAFTSTIEAIMQENNLSHLWEEIFSKVMDDRHTAVQLCDALFRAHRVLSQHFHTLSIPPPECIYQQNYMHRLALAFLFASGSSKACNILLESMCTEGRLAICSALLTSEKDFTTSISFFPETFCLEVLEKAVSYFSKPSVSMADVTQRMLVRLVRRSLEKISVTDIIQRIFLKRASSEHLASLLSSAFPPNHSGDVVRSLARVWSESAFISKGHLPHQIYLTNALTTSIPRLTKEQLQTSLDAQISLLALLSRGVSRYLDAPDPRSRKCGMHVATCFSAVLENEINFEDTNNTDVKTDDISCSSVSKVEDEADNSDDEFELYIPESPQVKDGVTLVRYLHQCLEMLRFDENQQQSSLKKSSAYTQHKTALLSIPPIVSSHPADGVDLSGPLVRELLRLSNSFNIEKFDTLRSEALVCLLCFYTARTVPLVISTITSDSLSLGAKIETVQTLVTVAYKLSGLNPPGKINGGGNTSTSSAKDKNADTTSGAGKTTITHPVRLAIASKEKRYFRNLFGPVADIFISPLLHYFNSTAADVVDVYAKSSTSESVEMDAIALRVLLPAQILLALSAYMRCCVNTPLQKKYIEEIYLACKPYRDSKILHLKRAAVVASHDVIECLLHCRHAGPDKRELNTFGSMSYLQSIGASTTPSMGINDALDGILLDILQWAMTTADREPDPQCRAFLSQIILLSVEKEDRK